MSFTLPDISMDFLRSVSPILVMCLGAVLALFQGVIPRVSSVAAVKVTTFATLLVSLVLSVTLWQNDYHSFLQGAFLSEPLGRFGVTAILAIALITALMTVGSYIASQFFRGEVISLFLMTVMGAMVLVTADDLVTLFVGLEIASIGTYALVGYVSPNRRSMEAAVKYLTLGSFATGFLLFGFALLYAGSGSLRISEILQAMAKLDHNAWMDAGLIFLVAGIGFKFALVPFHLWAPDAYEGAPTGITAYMATAIKVMILVLALRFFGEGFKGGGDIFSAVVIFLAICSMIFGNIMALVQSSLKRMLAYSSIAHSGYMAVAWAAMASQSTDLAVPAVVFYIIGYSVLSLGAFALLMWMENQEVDNLQLDDLAGIAKTHPYWAAALTVFMFSFAGFPPTVGFISKFFVFSSALSGGLYGLVVIGVLGSAISVYYYLRVIMKMYFSERGPVAANLRPQTSIVIGAVVIVALLLTFGLGIWLPGSTLANLRAMNESFTLSF